MKIARYPTIVLNINEWLPSYGENSVSVSCEDGKLQVTIIYDSDSSNEEAKKIISFSETCFFMFSSFPGIEMLDVNYEKSQSLGDLIEYKESSLANEWSSHFKFYDKKIRHFQILFLSANKRLEIMATDFNII